MGSETRKDVGRPVWVDGLTVNGDVAMSGVSPCGRRMYQKPEAPLIPFELVYDFRTRKEWNP